jgi:CRISPR/Cas system CSM-associated protein Csm2 small subunit
MNNSVVVYELIKILENINEYSLFILKEKLYNYSTLIKKAISKDLYKKLRLDLETIELELLYGCGDYHIIIKEDITKTISNIIDEMSKIKIFKDIIYV